MATYSELMAQAQALMAQAEQVRKQELANVIADIKAKMKEYGITLEDLLEFDIADSKLATEVLREMSNGRDIAEFLGRSSAPCTEDATV